MKKIIIKMYFEDKMKQVDIAKTLNVSKYKVSRIVTNDVRYEKEKQARKHRNEKIHTEKTKQYIYNKRERENAIREQLKHEHIQASIELSNGKSISNRAFREWNSSIYRYNPKSKSYNLIKGINVSKDIPKTIDWSCK